MPKTKFGIGDKVQSRSDPSRRGMVEELGPVHAGIQYYRVFWGGPMGTKMIPEVDLQAYVEESTPSKSLELGNLAGYHDFQRLITYQRLQREHPLRNNIYAFNA